MTTWDHFVVVERLIRRGEILAADLEHLLESLQRQGLLTVDECQALLLPAVQQDQAAPPGSPS